MHLSREDLECISAGKFSQVAQWHASDMDPNRVIIPAPPYLFMYEVLKIGENYIRYQCRPNKNPLLENCDTVPAGVALEFFQGYMVLADWMGYGTLPQNVAHRIHRALGGKFEYVSAMPSIHSVLEIEIRITKVTKFGKTTITQYQGEMRCDDQVIIRIKDFSGIFYEKGAPKISAAQYAPTDKPIINTLTPTTIGPMHTYDRIDVYSDTYLEGIRAIDPGEWCFNCHFVNDPCMPGSFLFQGFFDIMTQYLGHAVEPVPHQEILSSAKLHVLPTNKELRLCINIKEQTATQILCNYTIYVDDTLAFACENIGLLAPILFSTC